MKKSSGNRTPLPESLGKWMPYAPRPRAHMKIHFHIYANSTLFTYTIYEFSHFLSIFTGEIFGKISILFKLADYLWLLTNNDLFSKQIFFETSNYLFKTNISVETKNFLFK